MNLQIKSKKQKAAISNNKMVNKITNYQSIDEYDFRKPDQSGLVYAISKKQNK